VRRPRRKADETREDILTKAEAMLRDNGIAGFSIADLAAALGMSPANVFKHFHSKAVLADAICERHVSRMIARFQADGSDAPAPERLAVAVCQLMEVHLADIRENPFLFEMLVLMANNASLPSALRYKSLIEAMFKDLIRHGIDAGVYRSVDLESMSSTVGAAFASVLHPVFLMHADESELRQRCASLAALVNAALQSPLVK
jgi:TetR/AcrR family transcriptional repressor of the ameABC operon